MLPIHFAPLQGYTDNAYRNVHDAIFGGVEAYYTPFIRIERGELRKKDIREALPENDETGKLVPQIIVRDAEEFYFLVEKLTNSLDKLSGGGGYNRVWRYCHRRHSRRKKYVVSKM